VSEQLISPKSRRIKTGTRFLIASWLGVRKVGQIGTLCKEVSISGKLKQKLGKLVAFTHRKIKKVTILQPLTRAMTIFLVEDDTIYAEFVKKSLNSKSAYTINIFHTAEDGLKSLNTMLPDVLIIDYKLPGMSGIDLYEKVKSRLTDKNKVVMLSALDDGNMVLNFIQRGVRDYVIKDENVIESLEAVINGNEDDYFSF